MINIVYEELEFGKDLLLKVFYRVLEIVSGKAADFTNISANNANYMIKKLGLIKLNEKFSYEKVENINDFENINNFFENNFCICTSIDFKDYQYEDNDFILNN